MATYAVGDIQGCLDELEILLERLRFDAASDRLWFVGDLVNRGPRSLDTLRFVKSLGAAAVVVLGNHDLHLLAIARGGSAWRASDAGLQPIVDAPDADALLDWLQARPLLHRDRELGVALLHAGLPPQWDLDTAQACADEVQRQLAGEHAGQVYARMYGNEPETWRDDLDGWSRVRFTINAFTRLRVCDARTGRMALKFKGAPATAPAGTQPWFRIPWRRSAGHAHRVWPLVRARLRRRARRARARHRLRVGWRPDRPAHRRRRDKTGAREKPVGRPAARRLNPRGRGSSLIWEALCKCATAAARAFDSASRVERDKVAHRNRRTRYRSPSLERQTRALGTVPGPTIAMRQPATLPGRSIRCLSQSACLPFQAR